MNRLKSFFMIVFVCSIVQTNAQNAVDYMEKMSTESKNIQSDMWDYTNAVSHGKSARKVEKKRSELIATSKSALNRVKAMPAFDGSSTYRDSVVSFLNINYLVLIEDYAKIVDMEEIAEKSYDNMEAYLLAQEAANDKMKAAGEMVQQQQKIYADKHNITLIESDDDDLSKKMKIASDVYKHYNAVYLIFFKSYIQEAYLLDAIAKKDMSGIMQNKNALSATATEGLELLKSVESYNSDNSVIEACKTMLMYYKDEADNKTEPVTDCLLKTENFNKINESFSQIKEKNRTKEDVDKYNNAVNEMNASIELYNQNNEELNKGRETNLNNWNKSVSKFTDKHVPKGRAK